MGETLTLNARLTQLLAKHNMLHAVPGNLSELLADINDAFDEHDADMRQLSDLRNHNEICQQVATFGSWQYYISGHSHSGPYPWYTSKETLQILGCPPGTEDISGEEFLERIHPEDRKLMEDSFNSALNSGSDFSIDIRLCMPDKEVKVVRFRARAVFDERSGEPLKMIGIIADMPPGRAAEEQLELANKQLRQLFQNMREAYFSVDMRTYQCIQMSPACEYVYGYPAEAFLSNPNLWFEIILFEDKPIIYENHPPLMAGESVVQEYRIHHKDGTVRWVETKLEPTLDSDGLLVRVDGLTADITRRKEAEIALKESEYKFRSLIEYNSDAIMVVDEFNTVTYASNSLYRMTGFTPKDILGTDCRNYVHPADSDVLKTFWDNVLSQPGQPHTARYRRIRKDSSFIWCEGTATNLLHIPAVNGIVVNFTDITEQVEADLALKESEYKFRSLIKNSSDAITVIDEKFRVNFASDSLVRITGFTPQDVEGLTYANFVHPDDIAAVHGYFADVKASPGDPKKLIYRSRHKNGEYFWCERVTVNLLHDPVIKGIVSNYRDVTERREYIQALEAANDHLKKTNMELDKFVYSVSHDLRAPLSSMLGVIGIMESEMPADEMRDDLGLLRSSIEKLDGFILDILDYSKNARLGVNVAAIDFKITLDNVISNLRFMGGVDAVDISVNIAGDQSFHSDPSRVAIILNNLLSNAIRYRNASRERSTVLINVSVSEGTAVVKIKDNGIGIPAEKHDRIFEMFYRLSAQSTGSGLGLYIVKETVQKLNGNIYLESKVGEGTEFTVTLPDMK